MARFLFTVWPFQGHYFPLIALARALQDRGHACAFYTGASAGEVIREQGFAVFPFRHIDEVALHRLMQSRGERKPGQFQRMMRHWLLGTIPAQMRDLQPALADWSPDVIATDPTLWSPILLLADLTATPVAVASFVPACILPGPDAPPFGLGLPNRKTGWPRLLSRGVAALAGAAAIPFRRAANRLRAEHGLPPLSMSVTAYTGQMPLYLIPAAPEFDYNRRDLPPSVRYVGPCLWNPPAHEPSPPWLDALPRNRPWVHVSEGTQHVGGPFLLKAAADGLANRPLEVILTGGGREPDALNLGNLPANIRLVRWVSHSDLFPRTDAVVTTGGAGTVLASLAAGVPLVIVPTEWDKPEIAQRVAAAGAGLRLSPRRISPARLRAAVERVLTEPSFRQNARRLAEIFARQGGPVRAAELLEQLAVPAEENRAHV